MSIERHEIEAAIRGAFVTRGKHTGQLLARCPKANTDAAAAWQAVQSGVNPYKVGIGTIIFFTERQQAIFDVVLASVGKLINQGKNLAALDRDRAVLEELGAW